MYTLSEIARRTRISMATLQRYKKRYQRRIPSEGKGRRQRYPEEALPVFLALKEENAARRGRPRKRRAAAGAAGPARRRQPRRGQTPAAGRKAAAGIPSERAGDGPLTLTEVGRQTGISYVTLTRYARLHARDLPHVGSGRRRRYLPEAVEVFRRLRAESKRGRRPGGGKSRGGEAAAGGALAKRLRTAERAQAALERRVERLVRGLQRLAR